MDSIKIVADSSANLCSDERVNFTSVPLKIFASEKEFVDTEVLDVPAMLQYLREFEGRSGTSCPGAADWLAAFGNADAAASVSGIPAIRRRQMRLQIGCEPCIRAVTSGLGKTEGCARTTQKQAESWSVLREAENEDYNGTF